MAIGGEGTLKRLLDGEVSVVQRDRWAFGTGKKLKRRGGKGECLGGKTEGALELLLFISDF